MNNIKENSKILKLSYIMNNYEDEIKQSKQTNESPEDFLNRILEKEIYQKKRKRN